MFENEIERLFADAVNVLVDKGMQYGDSWKKRGGIGAFMMLARKWDRIELEAKEAGWDIFHAIDISRSDLLDDIRDLRNYLTLVEHEVKYGRRESDSDTSITPDSQESPGASPEELGVGDNGDSQDARARTHSAVRVESSYRGFDKA